MMIASAPYTMEGLMPFVPDWISGEDRTTVQAGFAVQIALIGIVVAACLFRMFFLKE